MTLHYDLLFGNHVLGTVETQPFPCPDASIYATAQLVVMPCWTVLPTFASL